MLYGILLYEPHLRYVCHWIRKEPFWLVIPLWLATSSGSVLCSSVLCSVCVVYSVCIVYDSGCSKVCNVLVYRGGVSSEVGKFQRRHEEWGGGCVFWTPESFRDWRGLNYVHLTNKTNKQNSGVLARIEVRDETQWSNYKKWSAIRPNKMPQQDAIYCFMRFIVSKVLQKHFNRFQSFAEECLLRSCKFSFQKRLSCTWYSPIFASLKCSQV